MNNDQLISTIRDLVLNMSVNYSKDFQARCIQILFDAKDITDLSELVGCIHQLIDFVKQFNNEQSSIENNQLKEKIIISKENYDKVQQEINGIERKYGKNLTELKTALKHLFETLLNIIDYQSKKIINLESRVMHLEKKEKMMEKKEKLTEKKKLIGDLLVPLNVEIHNYLNQLTGSPLHYNDPCIYLAYKAKSLEDHIMEQEYKHSFVKSINSATYEAFYLWIVNKCSQFNTEASVLCELLYEKKRRNFELHSDINDFFIDALTTYEYSFNDLLRKHDIYEVLNEKELNTLQKIFEMYYSNEINHIRQLMERHPKNQH